MIYKPIGEHLAAEGLELLDADEEASDQHCRSPDEDDSDDDDAEQGDAEQENEDPGDAEQENEGPGDCEEHSWDDEWGWYGPEDRHRPDQSRIFAERPTRSWMFKNDPGKRVRMGKRGNKGFCAWHHVASCSPEVKDQPREPAAPKGPR